MKNVILGILEDAPYDTGSAVLESGQTLVLFTDGVTEALNDQQQEFGRDRLRDLLVEHSHLPSSDLIALVQEKVTEFSESQPQHDDLTMVVIKRH